MDIHYVPILIDKIQQQACPHKSCEREKGTYFLKKRQSMAAAAGESENVSIFVQWRELVGGEKKLFVVMPAT